MQKNAHLEKPVTELISADYIALNKDMTVQEALADIRKRTIGESIAYFYIVDTDNKLCGVLPTRRLITAEPDYTISNIMARHAIAIPHTCTVLEACEFFIMHKFLAFPVIDDEHHLLGVVTVDMFTDSVFDIAENKDSVDIFETIGFRLSQIRRGSPVLAFRFRFPWLLASIGGGILMALVSSLFEATLSQSLILAFFLPLVLGLGESVSMQSMTVTLQSLRINRPTLRWYLKALGREIATAALLGAASGILVGFIALIWQHVALPSLIIFLSITLSFCSACILGISIPTTLHAMKLDPKIAAGPVTLAIADVCTIVFYFSIATILFKFLT